MLTWALPLAGFAVLLLVHCASNVRKSSRLPSGPPGWPLLGNLLDLPLSSLMFEKLTAWFQQHGPIYSFRLLHRCVVVLSNAKVAADILDRMSLQSGGRPEHIKAGEHMSRGRLIAFMQMNTRWRTMRKAAHDILQPRAVLHYATLHTEEARTLVRGLLLHPPKCGLVATHAPILNFGRHTHAVWLRRIVSGPT